MDWTRTIDAYCERVGGAFWAEPANAASNLAFILAGLVVLFHARRTGRPDGVALFLGVTTIAIGVGSFLFHTFATAWAAVTDTTPIAVFMLGFFAIVMRRHFGLSSVVSGLATLGFLLAMIVMAAVLNAAVGSLASGSEAYAPALFALLIVGGVLARRSDPLARPLFLAGGIFAVSLTLRGLDRPLCAAFPLGTHFLWHLCNAAVLGTLSLGLVRHRPRARVATTADATG